jgi:aminopeptidase
MNLSSFKGFAMTDPRVKKLAQVLVHYSLAIKPGEQMFIRTNPLAEPLTLAIYEEAIKAGGHVFIANNVPDAEEIYYKYASDAQLDYVSPVQKMLMEEFDALAAIISPANTRALSGIDPARIARNRKANAGLSKTYMQRSAKGEFKWVLTAYPTAAGAQEADMSLHDYAEFIYGAGMLNEADPVAFWKNEGVRQRELISWLKGKKHAVLKGANIDLQMGIEDRTFIECSGRVNFPDGEIFTGPVENSVNGWVRFRYPAIYAGKEVTDIELWFENGKVVKEKASKNEELLTALLNTDPGARYLGEWGIGTNYGITKFTKNMLFDEKIGGTIHLAVGASYPESGGKNESGLHWDMLCDMAESEITVDGELFYKDGKPVV